LERAQVLRDDGVIEELDDDTLEREGPRETVDVVPDAARDVIADDDLRRVVQHERDGVLSSPIENDDLRMSYREAVERDLDDEQVERLRNGAADVLSDRIEDRLDRLYAAKTYLQSDAATANSEAARAVVEEIADREYGRDRADLVDGETDRGQTH
jgi:type IV secretion system T-DNA border endonuclease VirD2